MLRLKKTDVPKVALGLGTEEFGMEIFKKRPRGLLAIVLCYMLAIISHFPAVEPNRPV